MDGVDPGLGGKVELVGPGEEADEAVGVRSGDPEGEGEGGRRGLDVVVADEDGAGGDVGPAGEEAGGEGGGVVEVEGDGGGGEEGEGAEEGGGGGGVEPEDEDGGDEGMGGVGEG